MGSAIDTGDCVGGAAASVQRKLRSGDALVVCVWEEANGSRSVRSGARAVSNAESGDRRGGDSDSGRVAAGRRIVGAGERSGIHGVGIWVAGGVRVIRDAEARMETPSHRGVGRLCFAGAGADEVAARRAGTLYDGGVDCISYLAGPRICSASARRTGFRVGLVYTFGWFIQLPHASLPTFRTAHPADIWIDGCAGADQRCVHPASGL